MKLLLVHGRGQGGKDRLKLEAEWMEALVKGLKMARLTLPPRTEVKLPFYGDKLDEFVQQFDLGADAAVVPKGPIVNEYAKFRIKVAKEIAEKNGVSDQEVDCSPSAPMRQTEGLHEGRISGSS